ncbi:MAG: hypothetical protein SYR96_27025 [Actinomycetota bacterium]|nr:hypothetical protein [Actinomycetota bacterium]
MEVLVVVQDPADYDQAIEAWRRSATVTQELSPWVALARLDGEAPDVPGTRWYTGAVPPEVLLGLDPAARLFVAAWRDRQHPKKRIGDGLSWDAPGFRPPDPPRGSGSSGSGSPGSESSGSGSPGASRGSGSPGPLRDKDV